MDLNDLLGKAGIDPSRVLVFRHRPVEAELRKVLPWLAAERHDVFNAYQQTHGLRVEKAMTRASYIASFIGHEAGKALFAGLYTVDGFRPLRRQGYWRIPAHRELKKLGVQAFTGNRARESILWFDLTLTPFRADWKGKLVVNWPPPERSWWRWSDRNRIPVAAILEESGLDTKMLPWDQLVLTWEQLRLLPRRLRLSLAEWRGIYYIFDQSDGKSYVGSASGETNLLGRWENYAERGDGGNVLLRGRDPQNFQFSILQRVSPDMDAASIVQLEASWKERLHTRHPRGLNNN